MAARKVGFVGIRTERLAEMVTLFRDILGVPVARQEGDLIGFKLADGTILELYGPGDEFHAFFKTGPVVGFQVESFDEARSALIAAGILSSARSSAPAVFPGSIFAVPTA
jgi:hypothetical protein